MLSAAVKTISDLAPSPLPEVELPAVPELAAASPLAQMAHGDPAELLQAAESLRIDEATIQRALATGRELCRAALLDLLDIGRSLITKGLPVALGLAVPNPAVQAAARAGLQLLIAEHTAQAVNRIHALVGELANAAMELIPIAQREVTPAVGPTSVRSEKHAAIEPVAQAGEPPAPPSAAAAEPAPAPADSPRADSGSGQAAVDAAMSQVGKPYVWGGTGNGGWDCSGLTQWAWGQAGVDLPRTADQQAVGRQVSAAELQPGDLVVWDGHVAMYKGDGQIIEAGDPVQTNPLRTTNMGMQFQGFWRPTG